MLAVAQRRYVPARAGWRACPALLVEAGCVTRRKCMQVGGGVASRDRAFPAPRRAPKSVPARDRVPPSRRDGACMRCAGSKDARARPAAGVRAWGRGGGGANRIRGGGDGHGRVFKVLCLVGIDRDGRRTELDRHMGEKGPAVVVALVELAGRRVSKSAKRKKRRGPPVVGVGMGRRRTDGRALTLHLLLRLRSSARRRARMHACEPCAACRLPARRTGACAQCALRSTGMYICCTVVNMRCRLV